MVSNILNKFTTTYYKYFPPDLHSVSTLPCELKVCVFTYGNGMP